MKLKTSYFNKTIFFKNVTLYWPIWSVYMLLLFMGLPLPLWFNLQYEHGDFTQSEMVRTLGNVMELQYFTIIISFTAVAAGMAMFGYLYKSQSANMIHSLPVDRIQLYGTNVLSGLAFLIVPQLITFVLTVMVCISEGITCIEYVGIWLLTVMATSVIAFGIVTFCAFLTGLMVALPIYVVIANVLAFAFIGIVDLIMSMYAYGVGYSSLITDRFLIWFSPFVTYFSKVGFERVYENDTLVALSLEGVDCIVIYFLLAIGLYIVSLLIYRARKIESAGEVISVDFVKPIFRWGVGTLAGFYIMIFLYSIFGEIEMPFSMPVTILVLILFGGIFFFIADMFVRKNFRVFNKKNWKRCGLFTGVLLISFVGLYFYAEFEEKRVPDMENVQEVTIRKNYTIYFEDDELDEAIALHKEIVKNVEEYELFEKNRYAGGVETGTEWHRVNIDYLMKDGSTVSRSYRIPESLTGKPIVAAIEEWERKPEVMLTDVLGQDYKHIEAFATGYIFLEKILPITEDNMEDAIAGVTDRIVESVSYELKASECQKLYDAIIAEATHGNLFKYNGRYSGSADKYEIVHVIELEYYLSEQGNKYTRYSNIRFGKDCHYILDVIINLGIEGIDSVDDILWSY